MNNHSYLDKLFINFDYENVFTIDKLLKKKQVKVIDLVKSVIRVIMSKKIDKDGVENLVMAINNVEFTKLIGVELTKISDYTSLGLQFCTVSEISIEPTDKIVDAWIKFVDKQIKFLVKSRKDNKDNEDYIEGTRFVQDAMAIGRPILNCKRVKDYIIKTVKLDIPEVYSEACVLMGTLDIINDNQRVTIFQYPVCILNLLMNLKDYKSDPILGNITAETACVYYACRLMEEEGIFFPPSRILKYYTVKIKRRNCVIINTINKIDGVKDDNYSCMEVIDILPYLKSEKDVEIVKYSKSEKEATGKMKLLLK
jgi:hypothetical protein